MKKLTVLSILAAAILTGCSFSEAGGDSISDTGMFTRPVEIITNPDTGFYRSIKLQIDKNGNSLKKPETKVLTGKPSKVLTEKYTKAESSHYLFSNLTHIMVDISDYSEKGQALLAASKQSNVKKAYDQYLEDKTYSDVKTLKLNAVKEILDTLRENEKTAIIRFHYDPGNAGRQWKDSEGKSHYYNLEPELKIIIGEGGHIEQICSLLKDYQDVITAVECGLIGPYGEMHGTEYGDGVMSPSDFKNNAETYLSDTGLTLDNALKDRKGRAADNLEKAHSLLAMRKFLKTMDSKNLNVPLLVRYPKTIYSYMYIFEKNPLDNNETVPSYFDTESHKSSLSYHLGMYNDGYLGTYSDYGTFKIKKHQYSDKIQDSRRDDEVAFLEPFLRHTSYGGELIWESETQSGWWSINTNAACREMYTVHLSNINTCHNPTALEWLDSGKYTYGDLSVFRYIMTHIGYRYYITNLGSKDIITYDGSNLKINLKIRNEGFSELPYHREKGFEVYLVKKGFEPDGTEKKAGTSSGTFKGDYSSADLKKERTFNISTSAGNLDKGTYDVYLKICNKDGNSKGKYAIRLTNQNIWNEKLNANRIGSVTIK